MLGQFCSSLGIKPFLTYAPKPPLVSIDQILGQLHSQAENFCSSNCKTKRLLRKKFLEISIKGQTRFQQASSKVRLALSSELALAKLFIAHELIYNEQKPISELSSLLSVSENPTMNRSVPFFKNRNAHFNSIEEAKFPPILEDHNFIKLQNVQEEHEESKNEICNINL